MIKNIIIFVVRTAVFTAVLVGFVLTTLLVLAKDLLAKGKEEGLPMVADTARAALAEAPTRLETFEDGLRSRLGLKPRHRQYVDVTDDVITIKAVGG